MKSLLKWTRFPYEEPYHIRLLMEAFNGRQYASLDYYTGAQDLPKLGAALVQFPFTEIKEHVYEIGSEDPSRRCACYLRLRFFLIRPTGDAGIEVRFNNNRLQAPYQESAEFTIAAEIAGINRLGKLLGDFGKLAHRVLEWDGSEGRLLRPETGESDGGGNSASFGASS